MASNRAGPYEVVTGCRQPIYRDGRGCGLLGVPPAARHMIKFLLHQPFQSKCELKYHVRQRCARDGALPGLRTPSAHNGVNRAPRIGGFAGTCEHSLTFEQRNSTGCADMAPSILAVAEPSSAGDNLKRSALRRVR